jgi:hypothetical protein
MKAAAAAAAAAAVVFKNKKTCHVINNLQITIFR